MLRYPSISELQVALLLQFKAVVSERQTSPLQWLTVLLSSDLQHSNLAGAVTNVRHSHSYDAQGFFNTTNDKNVPICTLILIL
jgi:hypothetical protein